MIRIACFTGQANNEEFKQKYNLELMQATTKEVNTRLQDGKYEGVLLAVAHKQFAELNIQEKYGIIRNS